MNKGVSPCPYKWNFQAVYAKAFGKFDELIKGKFDSIQLSH